MAMPDPSARRTVRRAVTMLVPDLTNMFYGVLNRGLVDAIEGDGYGTYVCDTGGDPDREDALLADIVARGMAGVVLAAGVSAPVRVGATGLGVPAVRIGATRDDDPTVDRVTPDDGVGSYAAVHHLIELGARRIGMIQGPSAAGTARDEGYRRAMADSGLPVLPRLVVRGDWTRAGGRTAMHALATAEVLPEAVFCANDLTAIGAIDALRELDLKVPGDVAVIGFDDIDAATIIRPALTTVRNPAYALGHTAGGLLLSRIRGEHPGAGRTVVLPCPLIVRESA
jgi:LacI family transcriptional regulator